MYFISNDVQLSRLISILYLLTQVEPLYKNLDEQFTGNDTTLRHA